MVGRFGVGIPLAVASILAAPENLPLLLVSANPKEHTGDIFALAYCASNVSHIGQCGART